MKRDAIGLQVTLDVAGRRALVIGGDEEAQDKAARLLDGGARVQVVAREVTSVLAARAAAGELEWLRREVDAEDLRGARLVLLCARDPELAERVFAAACEHGALAWCCDDPARSHLAMPALARLGRARIAISTAGAAPSVAGRLRVAIERDLGERFAAFVERLAVARERLGREVSDANERRARARALADGFDVTLSATYPPARESEDKHQSGADVTDQSLPALPASREKAPAR